MTATAKRWPRPPGKAPDIREECPLCHAAPHQAHSDACPWLRWAKSNPPPVLSKHRNPRP